MSDHQYFIFIFSPPVLNTIHNLEGTQQICILFVFIKLNFDIINLNDQKKLTTSQLNYFTYFSLCHHAVNRMTLFKISEISHLIEEVTWSVRRPSLVDERRKAHAVQELTEELVA